MTRAAWLIVLVACSAPAARPLPVPATPPRDAAVVEAPPAVPAITGRVLLDGDPVPYYGISVMRHWLGFARPTDVRAEDGRFRIPAKRGTWELVIAGPGFGRLALSGVDVPDHMALGDIAVHHGHTVQGVVLDASGAPAPDVRVTVSPHGFEGGRAPLADLADGTFITTTDASGRYRIDDIAAFPDANDTVQIVARAADRRRSLPQLVPDADGTIELRLLATGRLDVVVPGAHDGIAMIRAVAASPRVLFTGEPSATGEWFRELPIGAYDVWFASLMSQAPPVVQRVTVTKGAVTTVTVSPPQLIPVAVALHIGALACDSIALHLGVAVNAVAARVPCTRPDVHLAGVEPGNYDACVVMPTGGRPHCRHIVVELAPANQRFDLSH